ncbi:hypothetical protein [Methylobacterium durans]|nr:hypothetical protein [Methylobacterium durans]
MMSAACHQPPTGFAHVSITAARERATADADSFRMQEDRRLALQA